jgi:PAS domain-containing protein
MPDRLRASAGQLERILDVLAEAVTVTERDGGLVLANAAALERMGLGSLEEAMAASPSELLGRFEITTEDGSPLHPDGGCCAENGPPRCSCGSSTGTRALCDGR